MFGLARESRGAGKNKKCFHFELIFLKFKFNKMFIYSFVFRGTSRPGLCP